MFKSITLKFTENSDLTLPADGITVFVGPNNSGKSLILREIERATTVHPFPADVSILRDYEVCWPAEDQLRTSLKKFVPFQRADLPVGNIVLGRINPNGGREENQLSETALVRQCVSKSDKHWWANHYLRWGIIRLDGRSRFNLTNDQQTGDLLSAPQNVLAHLFQDDAARTKARALIYEAFGMYFVVDPTNLGYLRIRLSQEEPTPDEQSLNLNARAFHRKAIHIKDASDGMQAYSGIITAVLSGEFHTILIDEPEAFLHPPLARKLGKHLAALVTERGASLFASTHSADFLMGCVQAARDVRVVRLEYSNGKSRGRVVDPDQLESLFKRPLMRSANVITSLFYDGVVVTESDNDRAFYAEIYHRLAGDISDFPSILFVNAQNKQTIKDIVEPLRQFGVPAAAITDIDIIKEGGKVWTEWLKASQVPVPLQDGYGNQRASIKNCLERNGMDMKTEGGIDILNGADKDAASKFFDDLAEYGVFVVRRGELESWLKNLGIPGKKTDWTIKMLEKLGGDPDAAAYVRPADDDVWKFMKEIVAWIKNPARRGTS